MILKQCKRCKETFRADRQSRIFCSGKCHRATQLYPSESRCSKSVSVLLLNKSVSCIWGDGHIGHCSPNLIGESFGKRKVLREGPTEINPCGSRHRTWIVDYFGVEFTVRDSHLRAGRGMLLRGGAHHGYTHIGSKETAAYQTIRNHHHWIFHDTSSNHASYRGMPFFDDWNPDKDGAFWVGAKWITDNLGEKPGSSWSLDVVDHGIGFVPGNLRWAQKRTQIRNQRHKWLGSVSEEEFAVEARKRGYQKINNDFLS